MEFSWFAVDNIEMRCCTWVIVYWEDVFSIKRFMEKVGECPFLDGVCKLVLYLIFVWVMSASVGVRVKVIEVEQVVIVDVSGDDCVVDGLEKVMSIFEEG